MELVCGCLMHATLKISSCMQRNLGLSKSLKLTFGKDPIIRVFLFDYENRFRIHRNKDEFSDDEAESLFRIIWSFSFLFFCKIDAYCAAYAATHQRQCHYSKLPHVWNKTVCYPYDNANENYGV